MGTGGIHTVIIVYSRHSHNKINAAKSLHRRADQAVQVGIFTDICLVVVGTLPQFGGHGRTLVGTARGDYCLYASRVQAARNSGTNTVGATGDNSDLAL